MLLREAQETGWQRALDSFSDIISVYLENTHDTHLCAYTCPTYPSKLAWHFWMLFDLFVRGMIILDQHQCQNLDVRLVMCMLCQRNGWEIHKKLVKSTICVWIISYVYQTVELQLPGIKKVTSPIILDISHDTALCPSHISKNMCSSGWLLVSCSFVRCVFKVYDSNNNEEKTLHTIKTLRLYGRHLSE